MDWNHFETVKAYCTNNKAMTTCHKLGHRPGRIPTCLAWSSDGKYLASSAQDYVVYVYRFDSDKSFKDPSAQYLLEHRDHSKAIMGAAWHPQRVSVLATVSEDCYVYIWNLEQAVKGHSNGKWPALKPFHMIHTGAPLSGTAWNSDGSRMIIWDRQSTVTLVDGTKYTELLKHSPPKDERTKIHSVVWSNDDRHIVMAAKDGAIRILDSRTLSKCHQFEAHHGHCFAVDISSDSRWIATGGADSMINIFDSNHLIQQYAFTAGDSQVNEVAFNWNSKLIASCSDDHSIKIGYVGGAVVVRKCVEIKTKGAVHAMRWHPTRHILAYSAVPQPRAPHLQMDPHHNGGGNRAQYSVNLWGALSLKKY